MPESETRGCRAAPAAPRAVGLQNVQNVPAAPPPRPLLVFHPDAGLLPDTR